LEQILERLTQAGFDAVPGRQYLPIGDADEAHGVVLAGRFYGRDELRADAPLLAGLARLLEAYEEAYRLDSAHPTRNERRLLA
jgi:hypothetical protein